MEVASRMKPLRQYNQGANVKMHCSSRGVLVAAHELRDGQTERIRAMEAITAIDAVERQRLKTDKTIWAQVLSSPIPGRKIAARASHKINIRGARTTENTGIALFKQTL